MKELVGKGAFATIYKEDGFLYKEISRKFPIGEILNQVKKNVTLESVYPVQKTYNIEFTKDLYIIKKDYFDGENFMDYFMRHPKNQNDLLLKMVLKQREINKINVKLGLYVNDLIIKYINKIELDEEIKNTMINELNNMPKVNNLCHGDYHPYNILVKNDELLVIDWDNAINGNYLFDIARTFILIYNQNIEFAMAYFMVNNSIEKIDMDEFKKYLSYVAVECLNETANSSNKELLMKFIRREVIL